MSVDGIKLWLLNWLINNVVMLLVLCQLNCDVIGYEDSNLIGAMILTCLLPQFNSCLLLVKLLVVQLSSHS